MELQVKNLMRLPNLTNVPSLIIPIAVCSPHGSQYSLASLCPCQGSRSRFHFFFICLLCFDLVVPFSSVLMWGCTWKPLLPLKRWLISIFFFNQDLLVLQQEGPSALHNHIISFVKYIYHLLC